MPGVFVSTGLTYNKGVKYRALLLILALPVAFGCVTAYEKSLPGAENLVFTKIYRTDINTAWQAILESIKSLPPDVTNREGGVVQTKWTENTETKNFTESFGGAQKYLQAQYRVRISASKGFYGGTPSVKIGVIKQQIVRQDALEGWRPIKSDGVDEKTLLYRIGRLIYLKTKIAKIEDDRTKAEIKASGFPTVTPGGSAVGPDQLNSDTSDGLEDEVDRLDF
jgi:hypothetical protein